MTNREKQIQNLQRKLSNISERKSDVLLKIEKLQKELQKLQESEERNQFKLDSILRETTKLETIQSSDEEEIEIHSERVDIFR